MDRYIVRLKRGSKKDLILKYGGHIVDTLSGMDGLYIVDMSPMVAECLNDDMDVVYVELDGEVSIEALDEGTPLEYAQSESYFVRKMRLKDYWARGIYGDGVKVAVIDTGVFQHRDLVIYDGYNGYDVYVSHTDAPYPHGTYVSGVLAAQHNDLGGFIGVAPKVELYALKTDDNSGSGTMWNSAVIRCLEWCVTNNIDIVNCSFSTQSNGVIEAARNAARQGLILICATGNSGNSTIGQPAAIPECVAVGNAGYDGKRYNTSNYGEGINLVAYGHGIMTTSNSFEGYSRQTGTSIASPVISGIFALYKQIFPSLSHDELKQKVYENSSNADGVGYNLSTGYGIPNPPSELYELPIVVDFPKRIKVVTGTNKDLVAPKGPVKCYVDGEFKSVNFHVFKDDRFN